MSGGKADMSVSEADIELNHLDPERAALLPPCSPPGGENSTHENLKSYLSEAFMPCTIKGKPLEKVCLS